MKHKLDEYLHGHLEQIFQLHNELAVLVTLKDNFLKGNREHQLKQFQKFEQSVYAYMLSNPHDLNQSEFLHKAAVQSALFFVK